MKERSILHVAVILGSALMICVTDATTLSTSDNDCPELCTCEKRQITCFNHIPEVLPHAMEELTLDIWLEPALGNFHPGVFCNVTWQNVRKLSIINHFDEYVFEGDYFHCPNRLHALKLSSIAFNQSPHSEAPVGLINISNLEIHEGIVRGDSLYSYLQNFPALVSFTFAHSSYDSEVVILDNSFVSILSHRPIKVLDFSASSITLDFRNSSVLCDTLETLILRDSLLTITNVPLAACASLQLVDLSGNSYHLKQFKHNCIDGWGYFGIHSFFTAQALYVNQMFTSSQHKTSPSCRFSIYNRSPNIRVKEFHFSQNILPRFEIMFDSSIIEYINLSHNHIESIELLAFAYLGSCKKVDLSYNKLHFTGIPEYLLYVNNDYHYYYHESLYESDYKCIDFSSNNISNLPNNLFRPSVNIEYIKLSNNTLTQVDFDISHLYNLTLLDLRYNNIHSLDSYSRQKLKDLYEAQQQKSLAVLLEGNPFSCSCDQKEFIQWFAKSPVFDNTRKSQYCKLNQRKYILDHNAVDAAINDCEMVAAKKALESKRKLLASILPVLSFIVAIVIVFLLIIIYRRRKRKLLRQKFEDRLHLVQENRMELKFPVFLSYSSLDFDFVANHIRQPLQRHLQAITGADRDLVCDAEIHFIPGHNIYQEMSRCIEESAVFLAVISENYCKSEHCQIEIAEARTTGKPILLIFKEHVPEDKMRIVIKEIFRNFTRIKFVKEEGQYRIQPGWEQVCESIIQML